MTAPTHLFSFSDESTLHTVSAKWFIKIPVWEANRVRDDDHVTTLESTVTDPTTLQGPYVVIKYKIEDVGEFSWRVIDGQHRQEVLRRYFSRTPEPADFAVLCRRYSITNHAQATELFRRLNTAKPMVYQGSPEERLNEIVAALKTRFIHERAKGQLVALIRPGANRPVLKLETLTEKIRLYRIHERPDITPAAVVAHAETVNAAWGADRRLCPATFTRTMDEKATELGFFLGLDPACSWLQDL